MQPPSHYQALYVSRRDFFSAACPFAYSESARRLRYALEKRGWMISSKSAYAVGFVAGVVASAYLAMSGRGRALEEPFYPLVLGPMIGILVLTGAANFAFYRATGRSTRSVSFDRKETPLLETPLLPLANSPTWMRIFAFLQTPMRIAAGYLFLLPLIAFQLFF
jgi:hypothetical protein